MIIYSVCVILLCAGKIYILNHEELIQRYIPSHYVLDSISCIPRKKNVNEFTLQLLVFFSVEKEEPKCDHKLANPIAYVLHCFLSDWMRLNNECVGGNRMGHSRLVKQWVNNRDITRFCNNYTKPNYLHEFLDAF